MTFLNVIGVPWPYINEDEVRQFATMVRQFGEAVERTHAEATRTLGDFAQAYQGAATRQMQSGWAKLSERHTQELVAGCHVLAEALEIGADVIVAQKVEALAELAVMAATFIADQAAAVATFGLAEAAVPVIVETGKKLLETLKQQIIQYIIGEIIEAAAKPLFAKIEHAMSGLDWGQAGAAAAGDAGDGFMIHHGDAGGHLQVLRSHTDTFREHAQTLRAGLEGLAF
ncbi:hypothetical protein CFP65_6553 [Kitasatospora sp. MMS16-BH015]|uniref:WXG100-like domain-containing protein n=1 Tax=Kitasatospora sp. MMS16-BH015 TaxID=2018025 RepID=UPI000CA1070B|nr:hypothetical protein [Kitasatospora sp. MMS16-BH015]AUG81203.1 hypothetical protein CFP65_6553 [Kitasatospora sp. MMS16-BH015]